MFFLKQILGEVLKFLWYLTAAVLLGTFSRGRWLAQPYNTETDKENLFGYRDGHTYHLDKDVVTIIGMLMWVAVAIAIFLAVTYWPSVPEFRTAR